MALKNAYDQYKENSVYTASPEELTLMLYNGLVKFLMQAQMALNDKTLKGKQKHYTGSGYYFRISVYTGYEI